MKRIALDFCLCQLSKWCNKNAVQQKESARQRRSAERDNWFIDCAMVESFPQFVHKICR